MVFEAFQDTGNTDKKIHCQYNTPFLRKHNEKETVVWELCKYSMCCSTHNANTYAFWFYGHLQLVSLSLQVTNHSFHYNVIISMCVYHH